MTYDKEKRTAGREEKTIELDLTNAQLDMVDIALSLGIRDVLRQRLKYLGYEIADADFEELWNDVQEKVRDVLF